VIEPLQTKAERVFRISILPVGLSVENGIDSTARKFFRDFGIAKLMRRSNFAKTKGVSSFELFSFIFLLVFTGKNLYRTFQMRRAEVPVTATP